MFLFVWYYSGMETYEFLFGVRWFRARNAACLAFHAYVRSDMCSLLACIAFVND